MREQHGAVQRALEHYDQEIEFQESQKFQVLKSQLSPPWYDDRLDWLSNRASPNSTKWLLRETAFQQWIDIENSATALLWLQGIPGAGELFLAKTSDMRPGD